MGHKDMVSFLLIHGANITAETEKAHTPLSLAATSGHGSIAELLLEKGRAVMTSSQNARGLVMPVTTGSTSVVASSLDRGIPVDAVDGQGRAALSMASSIGNGQMALVGRSGNTSARNDAAHAGRSIEVAGSRGPLKSAGLFRKFQPKLRHGRE
jgi:ankyrin repeat protein